MKKILITILVLLASSSYASQKALTEEGNEVLLYENGTWEYSDEAKRKATEIPTNSAVFEKSKDATFFLKSKNSKAGFWFNPNKWSSEKEGDGAKEYKFKLKKSAALFGMAITEETDLGSLEALTNLALNNAKNASSDVRILKRERRKVNGEDVMYMEMEGSIKGALYTFFGHYHRSPNAGSTQFVTYTVGNIKEELREEIKEFLNGFALQ